MTDGSRGIMQRARELFPGGVNSPVRAFRGVGGESFIVDRGEGARIWDADGREYIDYVLSWGPLVLGHAPPAVLDAVSRTMTRGTSFGIPTEVEVELAELVSWLEDYHAQVWDKQIEDDLQGGRLDALLEQVDREYEAGLTEPL